MNLRALFTHSALLPEVQFFTSYLYNIPTVSAMPDTKNGQDIYKSQQKLESVLRRLDQEEIHPANKELILEFDNDLLARGVKAKRRLKAAMSLCVLLRQSEEPLKGATVPDLKKLVGWIESNDWSRTTKEDYKLLLKSAWKLANDYDREDKPKEVRFIKVKKVVTPPRWLPSAELVDKAIDRCFNARDKFLIALCYEGGFRTGEVIHMKLKDWRIDGALIEVTVPPEGKTGQRTVYLHDVIPYYKNWIAQHPDRNNPEAYLIVNLNGSYNGEQMNPFSLRKIVKVAFKRAGAPQTVCIQLLRKTNSSLMAGKLTSEQLNDRQGWVQGSQMAGYYVKFNKHRRKQSAKAMYGIEDGEKEKPRTTNCINPLCGEVNPSSHKFCYKCHTPLTTEAAQQVQKVREMIAQDQTEFYKTGDLARVMARIEARLQALEGGV